MTDYEGNEIPVGPASWIWVQREGRLARIGLTEEAVDECGLVIYLELPQAGDHIMKGAPFMLLETAFRELELPSPLSGEILEVNHTMERKPELVHQLPVERNWLLVVSPTEE